MKHYLRLFLPVGLVIVAGSLTLLYGQTDKQDRGFERGARPGFRPPPGPGFPPPLIDELGLTADQQTQIKALEEAARAAGRASLDKLKPLEEKLRALAAGSAFNEAEAREILNQKAAVMTELELIRLRTRVAVRNVLTDEQRAKLDAFEAQRPAFRPGPPPPEPPLD